MQSLSLSRILIDGLVLSVGVGAVIMGSLYFNPRLWLQDAPAAVRARVPALSGIERRHRAAVGLVFLAFLIGATGWSMADLVSRGGGEVGFLAAFLHAYGLFFVFNLFDLLVIDYLIGLVIRPRFLRIEVPGMRYEEVFGGWGYHFRAFLKGVVIIGVLAFVAALVTRLAA